MSNKHDASTSATPPSPCADYCCSAFSLFEADAITCLPDLSIPIHPLFAQRNFSSNFDYAMLEPSLRLATRLLQSNSLAPYLTALYSGVIHDLDNGTTLESAADMATNCGKRYAVWPRTDQEEYSRHMKSQCKKILRHLADMVEFDLRTMENGHIGAQTQMLKAELSPSSTEFFPRGRRSEIAVNKSIYDRLVYHTKALQSPPPGHSRDTSLLLHCRFQMAKLFCHEIGHAVQNAIFGNHGRSTEIFYKDHHLAEAGYELEYQLFGGLFVEFGGLNPLGNSQTYRHACAIGRQRQLNLAFYLQEWPSWSKMSYYQYCLNLPVCSGEMHAKFDIFWTVSNSFMLSLFTDAFWIKSEQSHSMESLHPPRLASWPFSTNRIGEQPSPMTFQEVLNRFGPGRACKMCSVTTDNQIDNWIDALSKVCLSWFDESLSKRQRKRIRQAERDRLEEQ